MPVYQMKVLTFSAMFTFGYPTLKMDIARKVLAKDSKKKRFLIKRDYNNYTYLAEKGDRWKETSWRDMKKCMERYEIMKYNKIVLILKFDFLAFSFNFAFKKATLLMLLMQNDSHFFSLEGLRC